MIVRDMPDGRVLCLNQTTHALMSAALCSRWGNRDFARPRPYAVVMNAIAQHDNGWSEWELSPRLRADGYPMDFLHGPDAYEKLALWQRGVDRAHIQHPYAGLLIWRHAAYLHEMLLGQIHDDALVAANRLFIDGADARLAELRTLYAEDHYYTALLADEVVEANTSLLRFGDFASLQVSMPWSCERIIDGCSADWAGGTVDITMRHEDNQITFDPWPFAVDAFEVSVHGRLLDRRHFENNEAYQAALAAAPLLRLCWRVTRTG